MRILFALLAIGACQSSDVSRSIGARCDINSECDVECMGPSGEWPGGFCTIPCDSDLGCNDGTRCIDESNAGICAFGCAGDDQCTFLGADYHCTPRDSHGGGAKVMVCRGG